MSSVFGNLLKTDRRLFRVEVRASVAHCNELFRAGILTRLEAERLKNGLWTILKRADFDRNYFDNSDSPDIFAFVEAQLVQLVNQAASALRIGRSRPVRAAVALRLWLRDETETILESLENLIELLQASRDHKVFAESFKRDAMRLQQIGHAINQMPCLELDRADETVAEIDFEMIAHELGFEKVLESSIDSINDRDFCVEFASAAALTGLHLSNLANGILNEFEIDATHRQILETVRSKSVKTFGHPTILLSILKGLPGAATNDLDEVCGIVFDAADTLKSALLIVTAALKKLALKSP